MTKMLVGPLNYLPLNPAEKKTDFAFYTKNIKGARLVPAIPPSDYLTPIVSIRKIKAKTFEN